LGDILQNKTDSIAPIGLWLANPDLKQAEIYKNEEGLSREKPFQKIA
jgi:hypothetical protein